jgi:cell division protein FtsW
MSLFAITLPAARSMYSNYRNGYMKTHNIAQTDIYGLQKVLMEFLVFSMLLFRMLKVADHTEPDDQRILVVGVFSWTLAQFAVNIMAMTGLIPVTGITLPLLSYGGTSMVFLAYALGLVLQISCYTSREGIKHENTSSGGRLGRAYHSSRRRRP